MLRKALRRITLFLPRPLVCLLYRVWFRGKEIGMTSREEQMFYAACSAELRGVEGEIVDLGCWMGSTSLSLAKGLPAEGEPPAKPIRAFDRFIWESWMDVYRRLVSRDYAPGESFLPEARRRMGDYSPLIELSAEDLTVYVWKGGPIKILLVDAMKSWELAASIPSSFYPSLREGSLLIHQDYKHYYTPWIHMVQYRLRDYFRVYREVICGGTVAFETVREIPAGVIASATDFKEIADSEMAEAVDYSSGLLGARGKAAVAAAHVMYFVHANRLAEASGLLSAYRTQGMALHGELAFVSAALETAESEH